MIIKHLSRRLFLLIFRFLPFCLIIIALSLAWPALESLRASAESLECYCPSCPENLLTESGLQKLGRIKVEIAGAVNKPGIYELDLGQRRADLLKLADGINGEASLVFMAKTFNLSSTLNDGEKIYIPYAWEEEWQLAPLTSTGVSSEVSSGAPASDNLSNDVNLKLISINTASAKELETLPGVGEKRASDIMANRPFNSLNELVSGGVISQNIFDSIKELITL
jgi:competence protein ComEA